MKKEHISQEYHQQPCTSFKFLDAYTLEDREFFFGRNQEIADIYRRFYDDRLLLVYGESGVGKTSLIQCGLQNELSLEEPVFIFIRSAINPESALQEALQKELQTHAISPTSNDISSLLKETINLYRTNIVIVMDQFEEFFLFQTPHYRQIFSQKLHTWLEENVKLHVIISIREEFYANLSEMENIFPSLYDNRLWLTQINQQQADDIITKLCNKCHIAIETDLVHTVLKHLGKNKQALDLPTLQIILDSLYKKAKKSSSNTPILTLQDYHQLGKATNILANFLEKTIKAHNNTDATRHILKTMVSPQATRKSRKITQISEQLSNVGSKMTDKAIKAVLKQLAEERIIHEINNERYELRHDVLAKTIQTWMAGNEKELAGIRQSIANRYEEYLQRGTLLDASFLKDIGQYNYTLRLDNDKTDFIKKSHKIVRKRKQWFYFILMSVLLTGLVAISYSSYLAIQSKKEAENLIEFMNNDLQKKLQPISKLDLMLDVQKKINAYYENIDINTSNHEALKGKAIALLKYANTLSALGNHNQAKNNYLKAHSFFKKLVKDNTNKTNQRYLSISFNKIGNIYKKNKDYSNAMKAYKKSITISQQLISLSPENLIFKRNLFVSLIHIADIHPNNNEALKAYYQAHRLIKKITNKKPNKDRWQHDLSISYNKMGNISLEKGNTDQALEYYRLSTKTAEKLNKKSPNIADWERNLSVSYIKLGDIYQDGNRTKAIAYYKKAISLREKLIIYDESNINWKRDYYLSLIRLGRIYINIDNIEALNISQKALVVSKNIIKKSPRSPELQHDQSIIYDQIGNIYEEKNNYSQAINFYQKSCDIAEYLAKRDRKNIEWQFDLATSYLNLARVNKIMDIYSIKTLLDYLLKIEKNNISSREKETINDIKKLLNKAHRLEESS